jgi:hypothetical protein
MEAIIRRPVNAFVPDASPSDRMPLGILRTIHRFKREHGGLWVGGTVSISQSGVLFSPNWVNRKVHDDPSPVHVPAADIRRVRREFGWVTGIVVVEHAHGEFRFRCYGARRLAATMALLFGAGSL